MALGWPIKKLIEASPAQVDATRVDCGTCPVSLQCIAASGGNGWRFECCGSTGVEVNGQLLIMDCQENRFEQRYEPAVSIKVCPLCSGDLVKGHLLGMSDHHRYVPTAHAKFPARVRLALWHKTMPEAVALKKRVDERTKKK
jgi:hypothetical protein